MTPINIIFVVIFILVFVLGVLGNGVVIWVTGLKMKKTVNTVWYLNLAVADFVVTAFLPLEITEIALDNYWPFGKFMCKIDGWVFFINMYASIFNLAVISVDRCVRVVCPVWTQNQRTVRKASWVCLGVWVLAVPLSSPYLIFKDTESNGDNVLCYNALLGGGSGGTPEEEQSYKFRVRATIITNFIVGFVVPFTVIVSCYSVIVYRIRNNRSLASQSGHSFTIIATVIASFFLCWTPFHIVGLLHAVNYPVVSDTLMGLVIKFGYPITLALAMVNSCLNPLLYMFMGQGFKDVFRRSIIKVLEKAFAEEPQNNTSKDPVVTRQETALSETLV